VGSSDVQYDDHNRREARQQASPHKILYQTLYDRLAPGHSGYESGAAFVQNNTHGCRDGAVHDSDSAEGQIEDILKARRKSINDINPWKIAQENDGDSNGKDCDCDYESLWSELSIMLFRSEIMWIPT